MKLAIGSDHAGYELKEKIKKHLSALQYELEEKGCFDAERCDYPDFAHAVAESIKNKEVQFGILLCGSGNGINMAANKHAEIRSAIAWTPEIAELAKQHNNANILTLPARFVSQELAIEIVDAYLKAEFEGGRHQLRVDKI